MQKGWGGTQKGACKGDIWGWSRRWGGAVQMGQGILVGRRVEAERGDKEGGGGWRKEWGGEQGAGRGRGGARRLVGGGDSSYSSGWGGG